MIDAWTEILRCPNCYKAGRNARLDHPFEHTPENVSLAEALVAGA